MIDSAIELPKINFRQLLLCAFLVIAISILNLAQFGNVLGTYIWPFALVWFLPSISKYGFNAYIALFLFILGIVQDLIFGQRIGIYGAVNVASYGLLAGLFAFLPLNFKSNIIDIFASTLCFLASIIIVGLLISDIPNLKGLILPLALTIIIGIFAAPYIEIKEVR